MIKALCVFGTRPEAIKMAPVVRQLAAAGDTIKPVVCVSGQHREMLDQVLDCFGIKPDIDLAVMKKNQSLSLLTSNLVQALDGVMADVRPTIVLVQGDTTTAMVGALAAYYHKVPVGHIEAGLRTEDRYNPFPEEINRRVIGALATVHFAPTQIAVDTLLAEGHSTSSIHLTGNTIVDALMMTVRENCREDEASGNGHRRILVTAHRRENHGEPLQNICNALRLLVDRNKDVEVVYPVHMNPKVCEPVYQALSGHERIQLVQPMGYAELVRMLHSSYLVLTDSGGIQEEAPSLGKPVLVMRKTTERPEGVTAGVAKLVGVETDSIVRSAETLLSDPQEYARMARAVNPYGDGHAAERIVKVILDMFGERAGSEDVVLGALQK